MKKVIRILLCITIVICSILPINALAESVEIPALASIEFNNATIDQEFSPTAFEYTLTLADPNTTPTLKSYEIKGSSMPYVNYTFDESKHQTGISVTLKYANGSVIYNFKYSNVEFGNNANNYLKSFSCEMGEVYPALTEKNNNYKIYIPSDLTTLKLSGATQDTGAYAEYPSEYTIKSNQNPTIIVSVTASNGNIRSYKFKVKRIKKTCADVEAEMQSPDFKSIIDGELFYQKPIFIISIVSIAVGLILLIIFISIAKRITVKVGDDEPDFFELIEENTDEEENSEQNE